MSIKKLVQKRLSLKYTKSEIALIFVSGLVVITLNYLMITRSKPLQNAKNQIEQIGLNR